MLSSHTSRALRTILIVCGMLCAFLDTGENACAGCADPVLLQPRGELTVPAEGAYRPAFSWRHTGADSYMLYIFSGPNKEYTYRKEFKASNICTGTTCSAAPDTVPILEDNSGEWTWKWYRPGDMWWAVTTKCRGGYAEPAPENLVRFHVAPCQGPELAGPSDNITSKTPVFSWTGNGANFYIFEIFFDCPYAAELGVDECRYVYVLDIAGNRVCWGAGDNKACFSPDYQICNKKNCSFKRERCLDPECSVKEDILFLPGIRYRWHLESWSYDSCGYQVNPREKDLYFRIPPPYCPDPDLYEPNSDTLIDKGRSPLFTWADAGAQWYKIGIYHPAGWVSYTPAPRNDWYDGGSICEGGICRARGPVMYGANIYWWWLLTWNADCGLRIQPGGKVQLFTVQ